VVFYPKYPDLALWRYTPFNHSDFHTFLQESCKALEKAKIEATEHLKNLPDQVASTMCGVFQTMNIQHKLDHEELSTQLKYMCELISDSKS